MLSRCVSPFQRTPLAPLLIHQRRYGREASGSFRKNLLAQRLSRCVSPFQRTPLAPLLIHQRRYGREASGSFRKNLLA
ncbi:hypothetical protein GBAR_LOCUS2124, partial [Geodia barretti]